MRAQGTNPSGYLEVHARQVALGQGGALHEVTVDCPRQRRQLSLEECARCEHYQGLSRHPSWRTPVIFCREAPLASGVRESDAARTPVTELMSREVVCVQPDVSIEALRELFLERDIGGAPVVDEAGRPVGVVSKTDLLRLDEEREVHEESNPREPLRRRTRRGYEDLGVGFHAESLASATAADVMTPVAFSVPETASVAQASALMALEQVHRLVVVSPDGKVAGLLTAMDVLRWIGEREGRLIPVKNWWTKQDEDAAEEELHTGDEPPEY